MAATSAIPTDAGTRDAVEAEAFGMSRTLIEIYFCVRYISNQDMEARAKTYVEYHARVRQEWQTIIKKYYPNKPIAEIQLDADVLEKAKECFSAALQSA